MSIMLLLMSLWYPTDRNATRGMKLRHEMLKSFLFVEARLVLRAKGKRTMGIFAHKQSPQVENIVLVHGVWADGSSWSGVIERLQKTGSTRTAVQLDLNSLSGTVPKSQHTVQLCRISRSMPVRHQR